MKSAALVAMAVTLCGVGCSQEAKKEVAVPSATAQAAQPAAPNGMSEVSRQPAPRVNGGRALQYTREVVAIGPRWPGSAGHAKLHAYLRKNLKADKLEEQPFTAAVGEKRVRMLNLIAKYPGTTDDVIIIAGHYDTKPLKGFVGANDGGSSTGLLLELANQLRGRHREGPAIWLVWLDGEESLQEDDSMTLENSLYGSRHLLKTMQQDGSVSKVIAFILLDMVGDAELNIDRDLNSTPELQRALLDAAKRLGYQSHFFAREAAIFDDHVPWIRAGVPAVDVIDLDYGYQNAFWHTQQDTVDKLSPRSFEIVGNVVLETVNALSSR